MTLFLFCWLLGACGAPASDAPVASADQGPDDPESFDTPDPVPEPPERTVPREGDKPESFSRRMSVKLLRLSTAIESETNNALNPTKDFKVGTRGIYASFEVKGFNPGATIRVHWFKDDQLIEEHDLEGEGDRRYAAKLEAPKGLVSGEYNVEVEVEGDPYARRSFFVGNSYGGPAVEKAALGTKLSKKNMPPTAKTTFKRHVKSIKCGVSFVDLPQNAKVTVKWVGLVDGAEELLHTSDTTVAEGGTGTTGMVWNPGGDLNPGSYKAEILVDDTKMIELPFTVK